MDSNAVPIKPQRLLRDLQDALPRDALVFVDGGANRSWAIHYWQSLYPRTFFCATGMASMGFGVAGAIGGKFAAPDRVVVSITGDGGFLMNGMEVSTAVHYGKQVIWVVLNDAGYGMIHHALRMMKRPDVGTRYPRVDCARVAEGLGAQAFRIREPGQINRELIQTIWQSGRPDRARRRDRSGRGGAVRRPSGDARELLRGLARPPAQARSGRPAAEPAETRQTQQRQRRDARNIASKPAASASRPMRSVPPPTPSSQHAANPATLLARRSRGASGPRPR